jgi:enhancing lycopene biosynthesis protein 2
MKIKKFAVVLAGCGVYDGAEIQEAVLTMLAIVKHGATYQCFAPDILQHHVVNHLDGSEMHQARNVIVEAARIARGDIKRLTDFSAADFDALIFPGGFGVAKNLFPLAIEGPAAKVTPEVERAVFEMVKAQKPIGALCIAPAMIAKILEGVEVTIGDDKETIEAIKTMGGIHKTTTHGQVIWDEQFNVFSTPCYMLDATINEIDEGVNQIVKEMINVMS